MLQDRPLLYFNKEKGFFIITLGLFFIGITTIFATIIYFISLKQPIVAGVFGGIRILIQGEEQSILQIIPLLIIIYVWKIVDGFIDGLPMTVIDIFGLNSLYYFVLDSGNLGILIKLSVLNLKITLNFYWIFYIVLFGYFWILTWEVILLSFKIYLNYNHKKVQAAQNTLEGLKKNPDQINQEDEICLEVNQGDSGIPITSKDGHCLKIPKDSPILFKPRSKQEETWIQRDEEKILFEPDETPLIASWMDVQGEFKKNWYQFYIVDTIGLVFFGILYGVLVYFVYESNSVLLNDTFTALFFPLWIILITAYKTLAHYLRAVFAYFIIITIQFTLKDRDIIDSQGIFLIGVIIFISHFFLYDLAPYFNAMTSEELFLFLNTIMAIVFVVLFFILIGVYAYRVATGHDKMQIMVSTNYFYVRRLRSFNNFVIVWDFLMAWLWPFNLATYRDIIQELRYKSASLNESWVWEDRKSVV